MGNFFISIGHPAIKFLTSSLTPREHSTDTRGPNSMSAQRVASRSQDSFQSSNCLLNRSLSSVRECCDSKQAVGFVLCIYCRMNANNADYGRKRLLPKLRKYADMYLARLRITKKPLSQGSRSCAESYKLVIS